MKPITSANPVEGGGIAVVDDDTPNLTTCYYDNGFTATNDSDHDYPFEWPLW